MLRRDEPRTPVRTTDRPPRVPLVKLPHMRSRSVELLGSSSWRRDPDCGPEPEAANQDALNQTTSQNTPGQNTPENSFYGLHSVAGSGVSVAGSAVSAAGSGATRQFGSELRSSLMASRGAPSETPKKSLVEQFYTAAPARNRVYGQKATPQNSTAEARLRLGTVALEEPQDVGSPTEWAEAMLNIDTGSTTVEMDRVEGLFRRAAELLTRPLALAGAQNPDLDAVAQYVAHVQRQADEFLDAVRAALKAGKHQYSEQMRANEAKLAQLRPLLATLAQRVEATRSTMAQGKHALAHTMEDKARVLEAVAARFDAYDEALRHRRGRQLAAVVVGGLLLVAAWLVLGRARGQ